MVAAYSLFGYIQPGPHMNDLGQFDERIWFYMPVSIDYAAGTATYLKFPAGALDHEIIEEEISLTSGYSWTD